MYVKENENILHNEELAIDPDVDLSQRKRQRIHHEKLQYRTNLYAYVNRVAAEEDMKGCFLRWLASTDVPKKMMINKKIIRYNEKKEA